MSTYQGLRVYRRAGCPLVSVECADSAELEALILAELGEGKDGKPAPAILRWDCCRGLAGLNEAGQDAAGELNGGQEPEIATANPSEALRALLRAPAESVTIMHGWLAFAAEPGAAGAVVVQGVVNLRDVLKAVGACVVLPIRRGERLPGALVDSVAACDLPLPGAPELAATVSRTLGDAGIADQVPPEAQAAAAETLAGLSAYAAEQALALSVSRSGLDVSALWDRKRTAINSVPGLSVWRGRERFRDLGGLDGIKDYLGEILNSQAAPVRAVVFMDEVEKALGGSASDLSGTKQGMLGALLSWWQDMEVTGLLLMGHPGSGKSAVAKAAGGEAGIPTVALDYDGLQGSLVGESGAKLRAALATISAVAGNEPGRILVLATCNGLAGLPPELRRRFSLGTWFFDLPSAEERATIWELWRNRYGLDVQELPACEGWTGAEIRACCDSAWRTGRPLVDAARRIVPVCRSSAEVIEQRRREASGRLLDAATGGEYRYTPAAVSTSGAVRRVTVEG